ncbi:MAG: hypothetical protein ACRD38_11880 [Nitrososphaerales archaeon]
MAKWKIDEEEYYYKIYDSQDELAGYFQPDYGKIYPAEKEEEIIQEMLKRQDNIYGGFLYVPLLKLNLVSEDADYDLEQVMESLGTSLERTKRWKECIGEIRQVISVTARKSHSDPDMLTILLGIKFEGPVKLKSEDVLNALQPIIDHFHGKELL